MPGNSDAVGNVLPSRLREAVWGTGLPFTGMVAAATVGAAWPSAGYGALIIYFAADLESTGTFWIFGWPFLSCLTMATGLHWLAVGMGNGWGLPALLPRVEALNRVVRKDEQCQPLGEAELRDALHAVVRFPLWNAYVGGVLAILVTLTCAGLELVFAGPRSPNLSVILRSGLLVGCVYATASLALGEVLTRTRCRVLRHRAAQRGLQPYDGYAVPNGIRVATAVVPLAAVMIVAAEVGLSPYRTVGGFTIITLLSTLMMLALTWLFHENRRFATRELAVACRELAAGRDGQLITGSIEAPFLEIAESFNAAARSVRENRRAFTERYEALFEGAGDAILLAEPIGGRVVSANARAQRLLGRSAEDLLRLPYLDLYDDETRERHRALIPAACEAAEAFLADGRVRRPDGSSCPVDIAITVMPTGSDWLLQAIVRDVSERQRTNAALQLNVRRLEESYRLALVLSSEPTELAEHVVRALVKLLEVPVASVETLEGEDVVALVMIEDGEPRRGVRFPIAGTPRAEVRLHRSHRIYPDAAQRFPHDRYVGERGLLTYAGVPIIVGSGEVVGVVNVMDRRARTLRDEDVHLLYTFARRMGMAFDEERSKSEREALTRRLAEQLEQLQATQSRLLESDRMKTEFVGMMSHELRTPLNILLGYTQILREATIEKSPMPADEQVEMLERMLARGRTLSDLIDDTLSVLRLEAGAIHLDVEEVSVPALFEDLRDSGQSPTVAPVVEERWTVDADVDRFETDRRKLRQIVANLVGNARKFTERGTIEVRASRPATDTIRITVSDTGCGIDADHLPFIFDLYRQAPDGRMHDGCGLGLYIVRRYTDMLQGRVSCESIRGQGTVFTVELPSTPPAAAPPEDQPTVP